MESSALELPAVWRLVANVHYHPFMKNSTGLLMKPTNAAQLETFPRIAFLMSLLLPVHQLHLLYNVH